MSEPKSSSSRLPGRHAGRGRGRGNDRAPQRSGYKVIDFDAKRYNNPSMKVSLVFPGETELTMAFTPYTIPPKSFVTGVSHESTHNAIKQAVYNILTNNLSRVFPLDKETKEALMVLVEKHYAPKSIGTETFRFSLESDPDNLFSFAAVTRRASQLPPEAKKNILCFCPPELVNWLWLLTDSLLVDNPDDEVVERCLAFLSPSIRAAYKAYPSILPPDTPIKRFSETCSMGFQGVQSSISLYMASHVDPGGISDGNGDEQNPTSQSLTEPEPPTVPPTGSTTNPSVTQGLSDRDASPSDTVTAASTSPDRNPTTTVASGHQSEPPSTTVVPDSTDVATSQMEATAAPVVVSVDSADVTLSSHVPPHDDRDSVIPEVTTVTDENIDSTRDDVSRAESSSHFGSGSSGSQTSEPDVPSDSQFFRDASVVSAIGDQPTEHSTSIGEHARGLPTNAFQEPSTTVNLTSDESTIREIPVARLQTPAPTTPADTISELRRRKASNEGTIASLFRRARDGLSSTRRSVHFFGTTSDADSTLASTHVTESIPANTTVDAPVPSDEETPPDSTSPSTVPPQSDQVASTAPPSTDTTQPTVAVDTTTTSSVSPMQPVHPISTFPGSNQFVTIMGPDAKLPPGAPTGAIPFHPNGGFRAIFHEIPGEPPSHAHELINPLFTSLFMSAVRRFQTNDYSLSRDEIAYLVARLITHLGYTLRSGSTGRDLTNHYFRMVRDSGTSSPTLEPPPLLRTAPTSTAAPSAAVPPAASSSSPEMHDPAPPTGSSTSVTAATVATSSPLPVADTVSPPPEIAPTATADTTAAVDPALSTSATTIPAMPSAAPEIFTGVPIGATFPSVPSGTAPPSWTHAARTSPRTSGPSPPSIFSRPPAGAPVPASYGPFSAPFGGVHTGHFAPTGPPPTHHPASSAPAYGGTPSYTTAGYSAPPPGGSSGAPPPPPHGGSGYPGGPGGGGPPYYPGGSGPGGSGPGGSGGGGPPHYPGGPAHPDGDLPGQDWRMHRVDPRRLEHYMIRDVTMGIDTLRPWQYPRPETGTTRNHAVRFRALFTNKANYLAALAEPKLGTSTYPIKQYAYTFPKLPKNCTHAQICDFLHQVCRHGSGFSVYVPPFVTMTVDNHTGMWYPDLPSHCHDHWSWYDMQLQQCLVSCGLGDSDLTRHLQSEFSGYQILWLLANIAGHPGVSISSYAAQMPYQGLSQSFTDYMQQWSHFLHLEHCRGVTYSDVYFVETFSEHLHYHYNDSLKPLILQLLRNCVRNEPVPIHFSPEHLLTYICSRAVSIGVRHLTPSTTPAVYHQQQSQRRSHRPSAATHFIGRAPSPASTDAPVSFHDVRLLASDIPDDIFATISSLMANSDSSQCDLCQQSSHLVASCPILHRIITDPTKTRRLLSTIERERNRSSRGGSDSTSRPSSTPRSPTRRTRNAPTRAIGLHDDDTDGSVTHQEEIRQVSEESGVPSDSNDQSDFP